MKSYNFEAIGTTWSIDIYDELSEKKIESLQAAIAERIELFDKTYSRFRPDSLVTKMSQKKGTYVLPSDAKPLLMLYKKLYDITKGAFTPLIGNVLTEAGYDATYSLKSHTLHSPKNWDDILQYAFPTLTVNEPTILDFGAAGKGYLVDLLGEILKKYNVQGFYIDGSGDVLQSSTHNKSIQVALEHPNDATQAIGVTEIVNESLCGSAGNRRKWGKFHHIIHPQTLTSPEDIIATWVISKEAIIADALTTCLFFIQPEELEKHFTFKYVIINKDFTFKQSKDFPGELFIK